jgi:hypothetical protein
MVLLMGGSHWRVSEHRERVSRPDLLGRLLDPHDCLNAVESMASGMMVAADNLAFSRSFREDHYLEMLDALIGTEVAWVSVPDVVGDAQATLERWRDWWPQLRARGVPAAFVAQDGLDPEAIPAEASCLFVGGTDAYKLGGAARQAVREAKARGLLVHVGRVNSVRRIAYAGRLGADSIDGSGWSRWTSDKLHYGLAACGAWWTLPLGR